ncbi:nitrate reductase molybdenum cofactor assembly chaperone [Rhodococcus triatomae]|uniref:Nitrate reductase delta subunit n=1 Tax=Rhodococcus triatomae TaxID=300028 RepID=A0A1G8N0T2_9NOCA|nr:nitrate reductase molybdenum cofactor assembly chaperone [Rhodococcus triatomae]QNG19148.1 nitrate reductase molybdenum cofactor assembly chaperone [Rhodococcus triatomae]QNG24940.1 nitrate reductase molybdenum cofactor assembly chaperone [Rhodococcus triatomae]SDI73881.1 nitrate reductase delta subunit [Rhodococcus triatomae]
MRVRRPRGRSLDDRLVWQASSLLLDYPGEDWRTRLATVRQILAGTSTARARPLLRAWEELSSLTSAQVQTGYVETFDLRRRSTLYLTYWTAGDTRNRGREILRFADAYREAGTRAPRGESADHLAVLLEFAATVDPEAGAALLGEYRAALRMLQLVLDEDASPYAPILGAVCASVPDRSGGAEERARRLAREGPPAEAVGLEPFTLTVPPRSADLSRQEVGR